MAIEKIETIEVGAGGAASIEFTSIPQDGVNLLLVTSARTDSAANWSDCAVKVNGSYVTSAVLLYGSNGSVGTTSAGPAVLRINGASSTSNTFDNSSVYFSNYASSADKSISVDTTVENNSATNFMGIDAKSISTTAILSIEIEAIGNFVQYSTASLYKIY